MGTYKIAKSRKQPGPTTYILLYTREYVVSLTQPYDAAAFSISSCSSPFWYISIMMSQPPRNSPSM